MTREAMGTGWEQASPWSKHTFMLQYVHGFE
jgi:hypothetical protein